MTETKKTADVAAKKTTFADLGLSDKLLEAIAKKGYEYPSEIQAGVIPLLLNGDKDIIGQAQTGTGKTASFGLPVKITLLYGGQNISEERRALKNGPHIVVGTPGRVKDHLITKRTLDLSTIDYFILDEADEMLNIGFREEIEEILEHTPENKKTLLFSATMPRAILQLAKKYMHSYDEVKIASKTTISDRITQVYYDVAPRNKFEALSRVVDMTEDFYGAEGIHGDIEQKNREKVLARFKAKKCTILVATDVAARWIDVEDLSHVVNYSFVARSDTRKLFGIERMLKQKMTKGTIPGAKEVVELQKKRLVGNIANMMSDEKLSDFESLATSLLELGDPKTVLAALIKNAHSDKFEEKSYNIIADAPKQAPDWEQRLFIAKGKLDNLNPGTLIKFIENETGMKIGDVWKIDILEKFSYMNVKVEDADGILAHFKALNPRQPIVVQAKARSGGGWGGWYRGGNRGGWSRGFSGGRGSGFSGGGSGRSSGGGYRGGWAGRSRGSSQWGRESGGGNSYGWKK